MFLPFSQYMYVCLHIYWTSSITCVCLFCQTWFFQNMQTVWACGDLQAWGVKLGTTILREFSCYTVIRRTIVLLEFLTLWRGRSTHCFHKPRVAPTGEMATCSLSLSFFFCLTLISFYEHVLREKGTYHQFLINAPNVETAKKAGTQTTRMNAFFCWMGKVVLK